MARFSERAEEFTTYDGLPVSREPPHGAAVVVVSESPNGWRYLILHRAHKGPEFEGDCAWTPPTGARLPGEEHDRYEWVALEEACSRCLPAVVADSLRLAAR